MVLEIVDVCIAQFSAGKHLGLAPEKVLAAGFFLAVACVPWL